MDGEGLTFLDEELLTLTDWLLLGERKCQFSSGMKPLVHHPLDALILLYISHIYGILSGLSGFNKKFL